MNAIKDIQTLEQLSESLLAERQDKILVTVSGGTCGFARGAGEVFGALRCEMKKARLVKKTILKLTGCQGFCQMEPLVLIYPEKILYCNVQPEDAGEIVARDGEILKEAEGGNDAALCDGRLAADKLAMGNVMGEIAAMQPPNGTEDIHLLLLESSSSYTEALDNVALFCNSGNALYKLNAVLKFWEAAVKFQDAANRFWLLLVSEGVEMWVP